MSCQYHFFLHQESHLRITQLQRNRRNQFYSEESQNITKTWRDETGSISSITDKVIPKFTIVWVIKCRGYWNAPSKTLRTKYNELKVRWTFDQWLPYDKLQLLKRIIRYKFITFFTSGTPTSRSHNVSFGNNRVEILVWGTWKTTLSHG